MLPTVCIEKIGTIVKTLKYLENVTILIFMGITGEIDPETGFVMDMKVLKDLIKLEIEDYLDHKNLNIEVEEFKSLNPTAENIAVIIWKRLRQHITKSHDLEVVLYETPRNFVTFSG